ncbi:MAG: spermidine synthase [Acidothermaceae bacterium]
MPRNGNLSIVARRAAGESFTIDTGVAELLRDASRRNAFTLLIDGVEHSHVDLDDPRYLVFEYVHWLGDIIDCLAPEGEPLDTVHLGGGAATVARYIAATRPVSHQTVFELDAALVTLVRTKLPMPKTRRLRLRVGDARTGLAGLPSQSADLVVRDTFRDAEVPAHLATVEFASEVREILRPGGVYLLNVADGAPFRKLGADLAALRDVFAQLAVVSEPSVFRGRRHGNLVVAASDAPLPIDAIARRVADGAVQGRVRENGEARAMARGHRPLRDAELG